MEQFSNVQNAVTAYEACSRSSRRRHRGAARSCASSTRSGARGPSSTRCTSGSSRAETGGARSSCSRRWRSSRPSASIEGADAIALWKQILELDPADAGRPRHAGEAGRAREGRGDGGRGAGARRHAAPDDTRGSRAAEARHGLRRAREGSRGAARTWRRVLDLSPGHAKALRVLRESYVAAGDWDGLEELYASQNDWEGLVDFLSTTADKATSPAQKLTISFRAARIFEQKLDAERRGALLRARAHGRRQERARGGGPRADLREGREVGAACRRSTRCCSARDRGRGRSVDLRKLAARPADRSRTRPRPWATRGARTSSRTMRDELGLLESCRAPRGRGRPSSPPCRPAQEEEGLDADQARTLRLKLAEVYARELGKLDEAVATYSDLLE
jgi:hypothetical protein